MRQPQLRGHVRGHCRCTIAFAGMVAASDEGHAALARQVRLGLGDLAGDESIGPGCDGRFKIILRTTGTPSYFFYRFLCLIDEGNSPI